MIKKSLMILSSILFVFLLIACTNKEDKSPIDQEKTIEQRIELVFDEIKIPSSTYTNLEFKSKSLLEPDAKINWLSTNQIIVTNQGNIRRKEIDHTVNITVMVTLEGVIFSKEFTTLVKAVDSLKLPLEAYKSDYGFASMTITNRMNQISSQKVVSNEIEFLDALKDNTIKIIKIENDLNMGYLNVLDLLKKAGKTQEEIDSYTNGSFYRMNQNIPTLHPILLEEGVGQLVIQNRQGLMIYSEKGITINHLTTQIKTSSDIVIRNIYFTGIWEWDDDFAANYDELDWDYFTIETTNGVWLDHLSFDQSYDGLIDVKGGTSNITLSYLWLDFKINDFLEAQFDYLEENYIDKALKSEQNSRYVRLRKEMNLSKEDIMGYSAMQKKGFNLGNTTMGAGFDTITTTIHHSYIKNLADRLPRLRQGDVHMYNVVLDHTDIQKYRYTLSGTGTTLVSQALVPTENGAVLAENNYFINVAEPIKTHQDSILSPEYTGRFKVVDSILVNGTTYYKGSSYEKEQGQDRFTLWKESNDNMPRIEFFMRNYQSIPYKYNTGNYNYLIPTENLVRVLKDEENHVGPGMINDFNWLEIRKLYADPIGNNEVKGYRIDESSIELPNALIEMNTTYTELNPLVKNFYKGGPNFIRNIDYKLEVDKSNLDLTKEGEYTVYYKFTNLHPESSWNIVELEQSVYVYDSNKANEIYKYNVTDEFNSHINIDYNVYTNKGTIYYALSNIDNLNIDAVKNLNNFSHQTITSTSGSISDLNTFRMKYLYMFTIRDGIESELVMIPIKSEVIIYISTAKELNDMIITVDSKGKYYILNNDIDLKGGNDLNLLSTSNVFRGVFDGNGYKIYNLEKTVLRAGLFMSVNGGMIKNLTLENFFYKVDSLWSESSDQEGLMVETKASDDAGILATYVYDYAYFENIKIINSKVHTNKNYAGSLLGRVRTGTAYFSRISIINTEVKALITSAKYMGGVIAGAESNTKIYMNDIYLNNVNMSHQNSDMIGLIVGRVRSYAQMNNIVVIDSVIQGRHNLGLIIGKEDNTTTKVDITNVFIKAEFIFQPDSSNVYSDYYGYIAGNSDAGKITTSNVYVVGMPSFNINNSKGLNTVTSVIKDLNTIDNNWWKVNMKSITDASYWQIDSQNMAQLK